MESPLPATLLMTLLLAVTVPLLLIVAVLTTEEVLETGDQRVEAVVRSDERGPLEVVEKPEL